jgi:hypothetical protein
VGDLIPFPLDRRRREPEQATSQMFCVGCGRERSVVFDGRPDACECGEVVASNIQLVITGFSGVGEVEVVTGAPTFWPPYGGATA